MFVGIDPGMEGAVAIIYPVENRLPAVHFLDTPVVNVGKKGKTKREYDGQRMTQMFKDYGVLNGGVVYIERQQSMPGQGVASTFTTGRGYGLWLGILTALGIPYEIVAPVTWKKNLMADMAKEKGASLIKAKQLFPLCAEDLKLKKHHGRADALLIAEFGRRRFMGQA
jgi:crossover junction endodeoxyribonuclease RuvC